MATQDKAYVYRQLSPTAVLLIFSFLGDSFPLSILMHPPVTTWYSKWAGGRERAGRATSGSGTQEPRSSHAEVSLQLEAHQPPAGGGCDGREQTGRPGLLRLAEDVTANAQKCAGNTPPLPSVSRAPAGEALAQQQGAHPHFTRRRRLLTVDVLDEAGGAGHIVHF